MDRIGAPLAHYMNPDADPAAADAMRRAEEAAEAAEAARAAVQAQKNGGGR